MPRIVFIGAGSHFGWTLSRDVLSRPALQDSTLVLVDCHEGRLEATAAFARKTVAEHGLPATIDATLDRRAALDGADYVVTSVAVGGRAYAGEPYRSEIMIPRAYGIEQTVADTIGIGGIFRFLRTAPVMLGVCADMEELCPAALLINYTNPMAMLTWACSEGSRIANVGLCHSVQHTSRELAGYVGVDPGGVTYKVGGINHQAWFTKLAADGEDLYPRLRAALDDPEIVAKDAVRFELFRRFGYFVTESSRHNAEYVPWFMQHPETREQLGLPVRGEPGPAHDGLHAGTAKRYYDEAGNLQPTTLTISHEYASAIIEAGVTRRPFCFAGNVMNDGLIPNLPAGCCVEVLCVADGTGVTPSYFGPLPPQLAAINRTNINVQELAVRAFLDRDRDLAYHACCLDPLAGAVLPLDRMRAMFDELWAAEGELLDYFAG